MKASEQDIQDAAKQDILRQFLSKKKTRSNQQRQVQADKPITE